MKIYFYNTLTKEKDEFKSINPNEVRMYSCGPTVYKDATIGNMRTNIFQDTLRRMLEYNGYKVKQVMNITDVGHLVSDGDEGEDKMIKSARQEHKTPLEIAKHYTELFFRDLKRLNIELPEVVCKATDNIPDMLKAVEKLVEKGFAYETSTAIYFDTSKLDKYPILSNSDVEKQKAGARVDVDKEKRNPQDFALWIKAPANHLMKWDSPWGPSYPGWHIECSVMSQKFLGDVFDIHTGGIDLIPTHHENEIAQSKGIYGKLPANYWIHGEYLLINGGKMSKSLGNVYLLQDIMDRGYEPLVYKLFCYTSQYRKKLNFTWEGIESAKIALDRLRDAYQKNLNAADVVDEELDKKLSKIEEKFHEAINDDLNMPVAMSAVWEAAKLPERSTKIAKLLKKFDKVLGIEIDKKVDSANSTIESEELPEEIKSILEERKRARENKDFEKSDKLRDKLKTLGYNVKDSKDGQTVEKI